MPWVLEVNALLQCDFLKHQLKEMVGHIFLKNHVLVANCSGTLRWHWSMATICSRKVLEMWHFSSFLPSTVLQFAFVYRSLLLLMFFWQVNVRKWVELWKIGKKWYIHVYNCVNLRFEQFSILKLRNFHIWVAEIMKYLRKNFIFAPKISTLLVLFSVF